jgi:hypothetical protein
VPVPHLIGGTIGGILLMNWMPRNPLLKVIFIIVASLLIALIERIALDMGIFTYLNGFNPIMSYVKNLAAVSFLVLFCLAAVGDKIYQGEKFNKMIFYNK